MWHRKVNFTSKLAAGSLPGDPMVKNRPASSGAVDSVSAQETKIPQPEGQTGRRTTKPKHCNCRARTSQLEKPGCCGEDLAQPKKTQTSALD